MNDALLKIQSELKVPKSHHNKFGGYYYRNAEDILEAAKPLCAKHGLVLTVSDEVIQIGDRYYVKTTAKLVGKDGEIEATGWAREPEEKKGSDASQITGAASSYARKYALNGLFAIDDTKDADHTNDGSQATTAPAKAKPAAKKEPEPTQPAIDAIAGASSLDELKAVWGKLTAAQKKDAEVLAFKDQRKGELSEEVIE